MNTSQPAVEDILPLSPLQEGMLFHSGFDPESRHLYIAQFTVDLRGELDASELKAAAGALLQRHANLRVSFTHRKTGAPIQVVRRDMPLAWEEAGPGSGGDPEAYSAEVTERDWARGVDGRQPPLLRFTLITLGPQRHRLLVTAHHLLLDGWSFALLFRELFALYAGTELPPVRPYRDYLTWLAAQNRPAAEHAWRTALAGTGQPTRLAPADRAVSPGATPEDVVVRLTQERTAALRDRARGCNLLLTTVIQGAWAVLLARSTGQDDVVFGCTVSGRPGDLPGADDMIGMLINTVPVRARLDRAGSLRELCAELQRQRAELLDHDHLGLTEIQRLAGSSTALFDTNLVFDNFPMSDYALDVPGLDVEIRFRDTSHFPLALAVEPGPALELRLSHHPELLDRDRVADLGGRLARLLERWTADPDLPLGALDALTDEEYDEVVTVWNDTAADLPATTLPELFEAQVARTPDATAVVFEEQSLTYRELDHRAERLAAVLAAHGIGPESLVAVALPRSVELIVALHGVLKAGAAYLPLDLDQPTARVEGILQDATPALILAAGPQSYGPVPVLRMDTPLPDAGPFRPPVRSPRHPAYTIFTSGSTGRPKGVLVPHESMVNRLLWMQKEYPLTADDRILQKTPCGFDVSVWEFFWPLLFGATLVVAEPGGHRDPVYLAELIERESVTTAHFVPSMLEVFLREPTASRARSLRRVICSGETLSPHTQDAFHEVLPQAGLHNLYGPTEASVDVTLWACRPGPAATVPIGRPAANTRTYVLDRWLRPVAPGVAGELYLSGVQLARGYVGLPGLTAERFVACPFGTGERMYRTGDLARWTADGVLEHLGRTDDQVKIRGLRVEPGEIQAVVARAESVASAAVVVREDRPGDRRLVAYVVPRPGADPAPEALRSRAARELPEHMVPSAVVVLDELPVTANGKLDRRALPEPGYRVGRRAPRTAREEILAGLFAAVLGLDAVGTDDDFFELGGNSLLAMRLAAQIRTALGVEAGIREIFGARTVAALTASLDGAGQARPALRPADRPTALPLSAAQRRLWFLHRLDGPSPAYHCVVTTRLTGPLDLPALRTALADLVERHETLRTVYPAATTDGEPGQVVLPDARPHLLVLDAADADVTEIAARPFDLTTDAPLRAALLTTGPREHTVVLAIHHIATDGWSWEPLLRDLSLAYAARSRGERPGWDPLPVQYADYTLWQRELIREEGEAQLAYWRDALANLPEELALPLDRARPPVPDHSGATAGLDLGPELTARLTELARANGCTPFMVVQAALAVLLSRFGAGTDIPLGTVTAGRPDEALEELAGFFVNTLVLRTDVAGDPSFTELLRRVRESDLAAFAHQDVPFEQVVRAVNPRRSPARHPLFQVMLTMRRAVGQALELVGLDGETTEVDFPVAEFDLAFQFVERPVAEGGLHAVIKYRTDLFDHDTVDTLGRRLRSVLAQAVARPRGRVSELDTLLPQERGRLLDGPGSPAEPSAHPGVHRAFEAQAARTPEAVALRSGPVEVTYRELNDRADRLAHRLTALGVGPEHPVAVLMPRSPEVVVALLAVLKTGGAYVPLHHSSPAARTQRILDDTGDPVLLVDDASRAQGLRTGHIVEVTGAEGPGGGAAVTADCHPDQLAYLMHTSGSTGVPKAVAVSHRAVLDLVADRGWRTAEPQRVLFHAPHAFDIANYELWVALLSGWQVVVAPEGDLGVAELGRLIRDEQITSVHLTAGLFRVVAEERPGILAGVREVLTGGDVVTPAAVRAVRAACPGTAVRHLYGPTEATLCATSHLVTGDVSGPVPIGRPLDDTRAYVLDENLRLLPPGAPGELYLAGAGLARGYHGLPGRTAERFLADPYGAPGTRMYRTGDLARRRADGLLEFVGRADEQLKIRGFRVELGEVEAALSGCPGVRQAVVTARPGPDGEKRLVGHLTGTATVPEVRAHLAALLPEFMVPSALVVLGELPLTANGKVNYKALRVPEPAATAGRAPRTPQEQILVGLFAELLGLDEVGTDVSFFDLGGHSLLATRLVSRIRTALGVELSLRELFQAQTVAALAERAGRAARARTPLRRRERPADPPLSFAQQRLWFVHQAEEQSASYNMPAAFRLHGALDRAALEAALGDVVTRHEVLRTVFPETEGRPRLHLLSEEEARSRLTLETGTVTETGLPGAVAALTAHEFDLAADLPVRAGLFEVGLDDHVLNLVVHHIAGDGWSWDPLLRDLTQAYTARSRGERPDFTPLAVHYVDYTLWQRELPTADGLGHWTRHLAGTPTELALPFDRPRPPVASYAGGSVPLVLDGELHARLSQVAREHGCTLFMVLQAGLAALLSQLGAGDDIPLGTPVAGRSDEALDDLVGFFVNTLVLRTDLSGDPTFTELLTRVRESDLTAYDHQDLPFEQVVEALNPERSLARHPLVQVMVQLQNEPAAVPRFPGITARSYPVSSRVSKFDLTLDLTEQRAADGTPAGLRGELTYATELFEHGTAERMAAALIDLLERCAADPGQRVNTVAGRARRHQGLPGEPGTEAATGTAPGAGAERRIRELFAEVLDRDEVGADDNFFALGGHSLLVTRLISRVRAEFGLDLRIREVFQHPTPAAIAARLATAPKARPALRRSPV
ncbi:amino acid adenylation domain-containing protein [Streptomyces sp. BBFR2]|uniref:amino acid adenylation domain-containing protein n=1 Tax=Streptomyces sp. BBFR2 TaxID=3372854 RepID=UPI0037DA49D5